MSVLGKSAIDELGKAIKQQYVLTLPFIFGNSGNANVMYELYERNMTSTVAAAYPKFQEQYPQYAHEQGWLWIIYKRLCDSDIDRTEGFLKNISISN